MPVATPDMIDAGMQAFYDAVDSELWDYGEFSPELLAIVYLAMEAVRPTEHAEPRAAKMGNTDARQASMSFTAETIDARIAQLEEAIKKAERELQKMRYNLVDLQLFRESKTPSAALRSRCEEAMRRERSDDSA